MSRILVIDDDPAITRVLSRGLGYEGFTVQAANSGAEGLRLLREQPADLVVLDIVMPDLDGLEVLRRLKAVEPQLPVLLLTARDSVDDEVLGFDSGADDYVVKPFTFELLLAHVRALLRRRSSEPSLILRFADLSLDESTFRAARAGRSIELTRTEYDLLHVLIQHAGQVLTRETLMERVWGYDFGGNSNVLETYIKQLRQKTEAGGESRLIWTARGLGYCLRHE